MVTDARASEPRPHGRNRPSEIQAVAVGSFIRGLGPGSGTLLPSYTPIYADACHRDCRAGLLRKSRAGCGLKELLDANVLKSQGNA
jgi:hypothetical protein